MHQRNTVTDSPAATHSGGAEAPLPLVLRGRSAAAERQMRELRAAQRGGAAVLIEAEPGLDPIGVARVLHARARGPLVLVPCALASTEQLLDILFGGPEPSNGRTRDLEVVRRSAALVDPAAGTIVLADVAELAAGLQRRLARVLRDGEVYVQETRRAVRIGARVVATAGATLDDDVRSGRFRADLHRRLSARRVTLAPLRERADDIPELVRVMSEEIATLHRSVPRTYAPAALTALASLPWPRNLDDLRNLLTRLHLLAPGAPARQEDVLRSLGFGPAAARLARFDNLRDARKRFEREYIGAVLEQHRWRMTDAAATLGIERANLYRKIRQLGLTRPPGGTA